MSRPTIDPEVVDIAMDAVARASNICQVVRQRFVTPETLSKDDKSPVTVADFASQAVVCSHLNLMIPTSEIVAEENADALRKPGQEAMRARVVELVAEESGNTIDESETLAAIDLGGWEPDGGGYWALDPIDGTKGFLRGDQYAIALSFIKGGEVLVGLLGCPALELGGHKGVLMTSVKGGGTKMVSLDSFQPCGAMFVNEENDITQSRFCESVDSGHSDQDASARIAERLGITADPVRIDSQAKYAMLAHGDASVYLRLPTRPGYQEKIWDHAAGMLCVQEAGGTVTDVDGKPLDFSHGRTLAENRGVVATNGQFHDQVLEAVQAELD
ncbi:MAG: 3'(2'),5'-bisphosphate nucleotidase [Phycisphaeraceae bacterium]|nr:3'(2'),5'-bisphosphate nucleotidase [Phycisphaeraceae bacterium]